MKVNDTESLNNLSKEFRQTHALVRVLSVKTAGIEIGSLSVPGPILTTETRASILKSAKDHLDNLKTKLILCGVDDFTGWEDP